MPDFQYEDACDGLVLGFDEVGRAPLAGPVTAACVYIPDHSRDHAVWTIVNDSKKLTKKKREALISDIQSASIWAIAECCPREIEKLNIVGASFKAMERACLEVLKHLRTENIVFNDNEKITALIDGHLKPKSFPCHVIPLVKGDTKSASIAAASILAKVHRDNFMTKLGETYPYYGWKNNAGYPTRQHLEAIETYGITDHHRRSFAPVQTFLERNSQIKKSA